MTVQATPAELAALHILIDEHRGRIASMIYLQGPGSEGFLAAIDSGLMEKRRDQSAQLAPWGPFSIYVTPRGHEAYHAARGAQEPPAPSPAPAPPPAAEEAQAPPPASPAPILHGEPESPPAAGPRVVTAEEVGGFTWTVVLYGDAAKHWLQRRECVEHPALTVETTGPRGRSKHEPTKEFFVDGVYVETSRTAIAAALTAFYAGDLVGPPEAPEEALWRHASGAPQPNHLG